MMDLKDILKMVYIQFGDEIIAAGKSAFDKKMFQGEARDAETKGGANIFEKPDIAEADADEISDTIKIEADETSDIVEVGKEGFDYYDGERFESQMLAKMKSSAAIAITSPDGVTAAIGDLAEMAIEVYKFGEVQETKRVEIAAQRDVAIANIEAQKVVLLDYLEKSFDERKENFRMFFRVVDDALEKDNMQELAFGLESIIKLAQSSPFKDLRTIEETAAALGDPGHEWDF
ncbi:MAG: hypothetical protein FWG03_03905 [Clostridiales bacterium]|nr:hypothetical protein [Clostridiales bacterium]